MPMRKVPVARILAITVGLFVVGVLAMWHFTREKPEDRRRLYGVVKVWFLTMPEPVSNALWEQARQYDRSQEDYVVRVREMDRRDYRRSLYVELLSNTPVSLYHADPGRQLKGLVAEERAQAVDAGNVAELADRIRPGMLSLGRVDGKLHAVPLEAGYSVFWYDRELFERLDLQPPQSWGDLFSVCGRLREEGLVPIALGNRGRWPLLVYYGYLLSRLDARDKFARAAESDNAMAMQTPVFTRAWAMLRDLVEADAFPENAADLTDTQALQMFMAGRAGLYLGPTSTGAICREHHPELLSRLYCFEFPAPEGAEDRLRREFVGTSRLNMTIWPNSLREQQAGELLQNLAGADVADAVAASGQIPGLEEGWDTSAMPEPTRRAMDLLSRPGARIVPYLDTDLIPSLSDVLLKQGAALLAGEATPEEAAAEVAERMDELSKARLHAPRAR